MFSTPELDEAAQAELDAIQKKLGKYKGKYGKDIGIDELEWVMSWCYGIMFSIFLATQLFQADKDKKVKAVTIIFYETSLWFIFFVYCRSFITMQ